MIDREKVFKGLTLCATSTSNACDECPYDVALECPGFEPTPKRLLIDVLALLREQEPRVLTVREVKRVGADCTNWNSERYTVLWLDVFSPLQRLHPVLLKWDEDDWEGNDNDMTDVYYFGTDEFDHFALSQYGMTWRCWTDKPTEAQREAASWYAPD